MTDEYIRKQEAIDIVVFECGKWTGLAKEISKQLKQLYAANVVSVVRCRDCARLNRNGYCTRFQNNISGIATSWFMPEDDDFCSYGERREEQTCTKICIADGIELPIR